MENEETRGTIWRALCLMAIVKTFDRFLFPGSIPFAKCSRNSRIQNDLIRKIDGGGADCWPSTSESVGFLS